MYCVYRESNVLLTKIEFARDTDLVLYYVVFFSLCILPRKGDPKLTARDLVLEEVIIWAKNSKPRSWVLEKSRTLNPWLQYHTSQYNIMVRQPQKSSNNLNAILPENCLSESKWIEPDIDVVAGWSCIMKQVEECSLRFSSLLQQVN